MPPDDTRQIPGGIPYPHKVPIVTLQCYGKDIPFGYYDTTTGEIVVTDKDMLDRPLEGVLEYLHSDTPVGSHILFGVPRVVYALREKFKDASRR